MKTFQFERLIDVRNVCKRVRARFKIEQDEDFRLWNSECQDYFHRYSNGERVVFIGAPHISERTTFSA